MEELSKTLDQDRSETTFKKDTAYLPQVSHNIIPTTNTYAKVKRLH